MRKLRIGEFTPLGFLIGLLICLGFFWFAFTRLSFATIPTAPAAAGIPRGELDRLWEELARNRTYVEELQNRVRALESTQKSAAGTHPKKAVK